MNLPSDPMMLLSYINTQLRDFYPTLTELCASLDIEKQALTDKLASIDYFYDSTLNRFV